MALLGVMAFGSVVDTDEEVLAVVPVTVLVVGATMIVVGSQEDDESVMVETGRRLVPKLSEVVAEVVVTGTVSDEEVAEVTVVGDTNSVSEDVVLGGSVTVVGELNVSGPVSLDVAFSDTVGRVSVGVVVRSVVFVTADSVFVGLEEPVKEVTLPVWPAFDEVAVAPVPEGLLERVVPDGCVEEVAPAPEPVAVPVGRRPDVRLFTSELTRFELPLLLVAEAPVPKPDGITTLDRDPTSDETVGKRPDVKLATSELKRLELSLLVVAVTEAAAPVPEPDETTALDRDPASDEVVGKRSDVRLPTSELSRFELVLLGVTVAADPVPEPVVIPAVPDEVPVLEASTFDEVVVPRSPEVRLPTPDVSPPTRELKRFALPVAVVVAAVEVGPVVNADEGVSRMLVGTVLLTTPLVAIVLVLSTDDEVAEIITPVPEAVSSELLVASLTGVGVLSGVVEEESVSVTVAEVSVEDASQEVTAVSEPVAVIGARSLLTPDARLLTPLVTAETTLLTSLVTAETTLLTSLDTWDTTVPTPFVRSLAIELTASVTERMSDVVGELVRSVAVPEAWELAVEAVTVPLEVTPLSGELLWVEELRGAVPVGKSSMPEVVADEAVAAVSAVDDST